MKWANFLHFYQPITQQKDILEAVVNQCYRPLFKGLLTKLRANLTINVSGSLFEVLDHYGFGDVNADLKSLYESGKVEFTSTACYHAFLPLLPHEEITRQIALNNEILRKYLGGSYFATGFFPPEMGYSPVVENALNLFKSQYIILDEIACENINQKEGTSVIYKSKISNINVFFRQRRSSNIIMSAIERNNADLQSSLINNAENSYLVTAMDGETFGHHRPGLEKALLDLFDSKDIQFVKLSDLLAFSYDEIQVDLRESTWASSEDDLSKNSQFISWNDRSNILHDWQWQLVNLMLDFVHTLDKNNSEFTSIRDKADKALASDQFFWASARPWWSVEMIEAGAHACLEVLESIPNILASDISKAQKLYRSIISTAFEWQRTGRIREMMKERGDLQRIPFKTRTLELGGPESVVYQAFIDMMKEEERKAAATGKYEKAILWRDAIYKIETKNDIYDAISGIDLLRLEISDEKVEEMINKYKSDYFKIKGGQPEQRSN